MKIKANKAINIRGIECNKTIQNLKCFKDSQIEMTKRNKQHSTLFICENKSCNSVWKKEKN